MNRVQKRNRAWMNGLMALFFVLTSVVPAWAQRVLQGVSDGGTRDLLVRGVTRGIEELNPVSLDAFDFAQLPVNGEKVLAIAAQTREASPETLIQLYGAIKFLEDQGVPSAEIRQKIPFGILDFQGDLSSPAKLQAWLAETNRDLSKIAGMEINFQTRHLPLVVNPATLGQENAVSVVEHSFQNVFGRPFTHYVGPRNDFSQQLAATIIQAAWNPEIAKTKDLVVAGTFFKILSGEIGKESDLVVLKVQEQVSVEMLERMRKL